MLLLQESQVKPCNVVRQNIFEEVVLTGVAYQGKLFFRVGQYAPGQVNQASREAMVRVRESQERFSVLIVEARDHLTLWQEDPELKPCSSRQAKVQRIKQMDLAKIVKQVHGAGGIEIRDRRQGLRRKRACFIAKDLAEWLEKTYKLTVNDSIRLAQRLVDEKVIYHLAHKEKFAAGGDFYRFYDDEI